MVRIVGRMSQSMKSPSPLETKPAGFQPVSAVIGRLTSLRPSLGDTSQRIADFIIEHAADVIHMSVTEVAERTQSSEGSVVGLCKSVGATGFQQLKISLAQDLVAPVQFIHEDLDPDDAADAVVRKIFQSNVQTLSDTQRGLDIATLERAVEALHAAKRIEVYGIGSSAPIAEDAGYRLMRIGREAKVMVDSHTQAISASLTGPDVATLTISHSGSTLETVTATRLAKEAGATTLCITNFGKSPVQAFADIVLFTVARETNFRTEAMTSRFGQLAIIDALIACLALKNYKKTGRILRETFDVLSLKRY